MAVCLSSFAWAFDTVVLDAGHGGSDHGGLPGRRVPVPEKTMTLDMAQRIKPLLEAEGFRVIMTRTDDTFVPLPQRSAVANRYRNSIFVSIHFDAFYDSDAQGTTTFYNSTNGRKLAQQIHTARLVACKGLQDRGVKRQNYHVLCKTKTPAVLVEMGFLTNPSERQRFQEASFRQRAAQSVVQGILNYRGKYVTREPLRA